MIKFRSSDALYPKTFYHPFASAALYRDPKAITACDGHILIIVLFLLLLILKEIS